MNKILMVFATIIITVSFGTMAYAGKPVTYDTGKPVIYDTPADSTQVRQASSLTKANPAVESEYLSKMLKSERKEIINGIKESNREMLKKKDEETSQVISDFINQITGVGGVVAKIKTEIWFAQNQFSATINQNTNEQAKSINNRVDKQAEALGNQGAANTWLLSILLIVIGAALAALIWNRTSSLQNSAKKLSENAEKSIKFADNLNRFVSDVHHGLGNVERAIREIPAETNKLVKQLDDFIFDEVIENKSGVKFNVYYEIPMDKNKKNTYVTLYVPKSISGTHYDKPSEIPRLKTSDKGKVFDSTTDVIEAFLNGKYDKEDDPHAILQKKVITYAAHTEGLKITEI